MSYPLKSSTQNLSSIFQPNSTLEFETIAHRDASTPLH